MSEPTQEQIKEFWEWCGLEVDFDERGCYIRNDLRYPNINIDLNNLFKYAVPFLLNKLGKSGLVRLLRDWLYDCIMYEKDPAEALFWALRQVEEQ